MSMIIIITTTTTTLMNNLISFKSENKLIYSFSCGAALRCISVPFPHGLISSSIRGATAGIRGVWLLQALIQADQF
jgi:hypothetical protein